MTETSNLKLVEFTDPKTVRLVSTAYIDEPAMAPLADHEDDLAVLEELAGRTSPEQAISPPVPSGIHSGEFLTEAARYGWALVNSAFCHTRMTGNRFNGPERGAWYASYGELMTETAQAEVAWHLTCELKATGIFENTTSYREFFAGFTSQFHCLDAETQGDMLNPDPDIAYPTGQSLARGILTSGGNGILYPSLRRTSGQCLVALRPHLVQNIRRGTIWDFVWNGSPTPEISERRTYS